MALPVDFKDDILESSMGGKRRYNLIQNSDGTVSLEDVTEYTQIGSNFGAAQINATNGKVNELDTSKQALLYKGTSTAESMDDIVALGVYWVRKTTTTDAPATYGILEVSRYGATSSILIQKFYGFAERGQLISRYYGNDQWYAWTAHATEANIIDSLEDIAANTTSGKIAGALAVKSLNTNKLGTTGNASNVTNTFSEASSRTNLASGEKLSVSLGKIMKWFADLGTAAFRSVANNLTTAAAGTTVLDGYQGKILNDKMTSNRTWKLVGSSTSSVDISSIADAAIEYYVAIRFAGTDNTTLRIPILIPKIAGSGNYIQGFYYKYGPSSFYSGSVCVEYTAAKTIKILTSWCSVVQDGTAVMSPTYTEYVYYR